MLWYVAVLRPVTALVVDKCVYPGASMRTDAECLHTFKTLFICYVIHNKRCIGPPEIKSGERCISNKGRCSMHK